MFDIITWLVTRKCGLNCQYCNFRDGAPEANTEAKIDALRIMESWGEERPIILLGGDVLCMKDQVEFLDRLNLSPNPYGYQTSAYDYKKMELIIGKLKNLSISFDPLDFADYSRTSKSLKGLFWAGHAKALYPDIDIHATLTLDAENFTYAPVAVQILSELRIWSEITLVHWEKKSFDLVPPRRAIPAFTDGDLPKLREVADELIKLKERGLRIHSTVEFFNAWKEHAVDLNWVCRAPYSCVVDSDLSMRMCLHAPGRRVPKWSVKNLENKASWPAFLEDWEADKTDHCPGCFWDCQFEAQMNHSKSGNWFGHEG